MMVLGCRSPGTIESSSFIAFHSAFRIFAGAERPMSPGVQEGRVGSKS